MKRFIKYGVVLKKGVSRLLRCLYYCVKWGQLLLVLLPTLGLYDVITPTYVWINCEANIYL